MTYVGTSRHDAFQTNFAQLKLTFKCFSVTECMKKIIK